VFMAWGTGGVVSCAWSILSESLVGLRVKKRRFPSVFRAMPLMY